MTSDFSRPDMIDRAAGLAGSASRLALREPRPEYIAGAEACRLSVKHMTPVILLSDGFIANGTEPWKLPDLDALPKFPVTFHEDADDFRPYSRDPKTLARPWAVPGTPGLEHRVGVLVAGGEGEAEAVRGELHDPGDVLRTEERREIDRRGRW